MISETTALQQARAALQARLGRLQLRPGPGGTWTIEDPQGVACQLQVIERATLRPSQVLTLEARARAAGPLLVVSRYLSPHTRDLLEAAGLGYADSTGNLYLALASPQVHVSVRATDRDPNPPTGAIASLRGRSAPRVVRGLIDHVPPYGVRQLAQAIHATPAAVSRVLSLLDAEGLVTRSKSGGVAALDWLGVLRRWVQDYGLRSTHDPVRFLNPLTLPQLQQRLRDLPLRHAVTGQLAAQLGLPEPVPVRLVAVYVEDIFATADRLGLVPADRAENVWLIAPREPCVFDRPWPGAGSGSQVVAGPSQVAADLLTSPGRGPALAEPLLRWMAEHEDRWRSSL